MSTSGGVNVLRYSALGLGVLYGFFHQRTVTKNLRAEAQRQEYNRKLNLINQAKAEFARLKNPQSASGDGVIRDPMDPNFDLEAFFNALVKENP